MKAPHASRDGSALASLGRQGYTGRTMHRPQSPGLSRPADILPILRDDVAMQQPGPVPRHYRVVGFTAAAHEANTMPPFVYRVYRGHYQLRRSLRRRRCQSSALLQHGFLPSLAAPAFLTTAILSKDAAQPRHIGAFRLIAMTIHSRRNRRALGIRRRGPGRGMPSCAEEIRLLDISPRQPRASTASTCFLLRCFFIAHIAFAARKYRHSPLMPGAF